MEEQHKECESCMCVCVCTRDLLDQLLHDVIVTCLRMALSDGMSTIAFPTLGCGRLGYCTNDVVSCFQRAASSVGGLQVTSSASLSLSVCVCVCVFAQNVFYSRFPCVQLVFALCICASHHPSGQSRHCQEISCKINSIGCKSEPAIPLCGPSSTPSSHLWANCFHKPFTWCQVVVPLSFAEHSTETVISTLPPASLWSSNQIKSNLCLLNWKARKLTITADDEHDSKAQEALTAALVNNSKISTRNS